MNIAYPTTKKKTRHTSKSEQLVLGMRKQELSLRAAS
jgi:hypothetical protein